MSRTCALFSMNERWRLWEQTDLLTLPISSRSSCNCGIFWTLNAKTPGRLYDANRNPVSEVDDPRITFVSSMKAAVADMPGGKGFGRIMSLTSETRNALAQTLHGLIYIIRRLLRENHAYVLPGIFQSNRLEGEFGIYRYMSATFLSHSYSPPTLDFADSDILLID